MPAYHSAIFALNCCLVSQPFDHGAFLLAFICIDLSYLLMICFVKKKNLLMITLSSVIDILICFSFVASQDYVGYI